MTQIFYGVPNKYVCITQICLDSAKDSEYIEIPSTDGERANLYGDPAPHELKHILTVSNNGETHRYDCGMILRMKKEQVAPKTTNLKVRADLNIINPRERLVDVQSRLAFLNGVIFHEGVEQLMSIMYVKPNDAVLELGSNIGRNSLMISSILDDETRLVTLETDAKIVQQLLLNKAVNNMKFNVENAALTKQQLIQKENSWQTTPSDIVPPGHFRVNNITLDELVKKYNIDFNVLVADCEGALFYIFQEFPELLQGSMKTLIIENDYNDIEHKKFVDECFHKNSFRRVWYQGGGWGPCADYFWEVWQK